VGQTDGNGSFTYTEVENSSQIGSYTEVWTVGQYTVSPSVSFLVGQLGNPGTISTTAMGQTSDSDITGVSTLSITNGVVSTYSATELNDTASLYYDSQTVATLFDDGTQVAQTSAYAYGGSASANLTANATAWDDYDLQTDHYAVAYFVSGGYYENPFDYDGEGACFDDSGDCTFGSGGGDDYYVTVATIYLGSTVADQEYAPDNGNQAPLLGLDMYSSFLAQVGQSPTTSVWQYLIEWNSSIGTIAGAAIVAENALNPQRFHPGPYPIPRELELVSDVYEDPSAASKLRIRTYLIRDTNGFPWCCNHPLTVTEQFTAILGTGIVPEAHNWILGRGDDIDSNGQMSDNHQLNPNNSNPVSFWQRYWASGFNAPNFNPPSILGYPPGIVPLMIKDLKSHCKPGVFGTQGMYFNSNFIGINGDMGPQTPCAP
jgi:hypothetical protein